MLAPGHFHAALVQKEMIPGVSPRVFVYAPLDYDLLAHLSRVQAFNTRSTNPTAWELDVRAGSNYLERYLREPVGNTAVIAGRNRLKIDRILASLMAGLNVLADKPWIVDFADFPKLERVLREAEVRDQLAWDMMTERFEVTNRLQRDLIQDPDVFGQPLPGTAQEPGLILESVHHLKKLVAGRPLIRPAWWFDPTEAGEGMADVGTHLADLAMWLLFPEEPIDHRRDIHLLSATRSDLKLTREQFTAVTALPDFPLSLTSLVQNGQLAYAANGSVDFTLKGVHIRLSVVWEYEAAPGHGDTHESLARGSRAKVAIRHAPGSSGGVSRPELYVAANEPGDHTGVLAAVRRRCEQWNSEYPGVAAVDLGGQVQVTIPDNLRIGHETHFAEMFREFRGHFCQPRGVPLWERANLLTKYYITTRAVEMAKNPVAG